jgi:lipopolysaccharide transport system ATP-binding protein
MVLATHNTKVAREWCTRAIRLEAGRIVADGPVEEVVVDSPPLAPLGVAG